MELERGSGGSYARAARLFGATALACIFAFAPLPPKAALAQGAESLAPTLSSSDQMLLEADTLTYDNDIETVTASGAVQIDYGGNKLVAQRVVYDRKSGRLKAYGNVEIVDTRGNHIFSQEIDITEDFRDGFVNALRVETANRTFFGAESAERVDGEVTTFNSGVYTACEPCAEKPDKAPVWRIKARKIIWDSKEKTVRFRHARFELFGLPIAYLPYFKMADPTVKRKSGFLFPGIHYKKSLGIGASVPYYLALSPTYDLTMTGTYFQRQGFLGEAEWRQRFDSGQYNLKIAGIHQQNPGAFAAGTVDAVNRNRWMVGSKGKFEINPRWTFGWDVLAQSDKNFSRTYSIDGFLQSVHRSEIYLTGLNDRNYFDLRGYRFDVQEATRSAAASRQPRQPSVASLDYTKTVDRPVLGGELSFDVNVQAIDRNVGDYSVASAANPVPGIANGDTYRVHGIGGNSSRITAEAEWRKQIITDGGVVVTPMLSARADGIQSDPNANSITQIGNMAGALSGVAYSHNGSSYGTVTADLRSSYFRPMATAGLELRWPILFAGVSSTHVFEPMAQLFVRPDDNFAYRLGIPNEDAQSFVFDASTLFERDKFSGYDRVESGTRANIGVRYSGTFSNGWATNGIFGQSYHLGGRNPFAEPDLLNVGAFSGLETDTSDFVGLLGVTSPNGFSFSASGRFDEQTLEMRRADIKAGYNTVPLALSARYAYIQAQPLYGFVNDRKELTLAASAKLHENWRAFGTGSYDFESSRLVRSSIGFTYDDECFTYSMSLTDYNPPVGERSQTVGFKLAFRTLGDFGSDTSKLD